MVKNKLIKFNDEPVYDKVRLIEKDKENNLFVGEHNVDGKPSGFIQYFQENGDITEGTFTPDCEKHGFCITYSGYLNEI